MPGMNGSNGSTTTETTTTTMLVVPVARLEGCVGLSVSDPDLFSESADAVSVMKRVLARAAGGVKVDYVHVSITAGSSCESGRRLSWGYRRLQDSVRVDYVIIFPASMGEGEALKQAENGKTALEQISLSEINALMSEEISMVPSLSGLSVFDHDKPNSCDDSLREHQQQPERQQWQHYHRNQPHDHDDHHRRCTCLA